jgi:hypothetical protein
MKKTDFYLNQIYDIVKTDDNLNSYSLMNGILGETLFLAHYYLEFNEQESFDFLNKKLNLATELLIQQKTMDFSIADGITGYLWILNYLEQLGYISLSSETRIKNLKSYVSQNVLKELEFNPDFLYGTIGFAHYLVNNKNDENIEKQINKVSDLLLEKSIYEPKYNFRYWIDDEGNSINMGFAHGQLSILTFFIKVYLISNDSKTLSVIKQIFNFMYSRICFSNKSYSFTPSEVQVTFNNNIITSDGYNTRLGWCYGDLSYIYVLIKAAETLNLTDEKSILQTLLIQTFEKQNLKNYSVIDSIFCHGYSGLLAMALSIDNECLISTKLNYAHWQKEFYNNLNDSSINKRINFLHPSFGLTECDSSLLEGLSGIGLTLLSEKNKKHLSFLQFFSW